MSTILETVGSSLVSAAFMILLITIMKNPNAFLILKNPGLYLRLRKYALHTKRSVLVLTHGRETSMFGGSMLCMNDVLKTEKFLRKLGPGQGADIILTTYGGELVAGLRLARVLKAYPEVRLIVPKHAFSAGTLASLGAHQVLAHPDSMFGPVDPQFGGLLDGQRSAKDWAHVAQAKGSEAKDSTLANAEVSRRVMVEMSGYLDDLLPLASDREGVKELLLTGDHSHIKAVRPSTLKLLGLPFTSSLEYGMDEDDLAGSIAEHAQDGLHTYRLDEVHA